MKRQKFSLKNYLNSCKWLGLLCSLAISSGCSVTGKFNQATVTAGAAAWKIQPVSVRKSYPIWFQSVYFTAELQTSDIERWELYLLSREDLGEAVALAYGELRYREGKSTTIQTFPLQLTHVEPPTTEQPYFRYTYKFGDDAAAFYQEYLPQRFSYQTGPLQLYYLQPLFLKESVSLGSIIRVEYGFMPEYGPQTVGELMRLMFNLRKTDWLQFCQSHDYIYDKSSACGSVQINEQTSANPELVSPADFPDHRIGE